LLLHDATEAFLPDLAPQIKSAIPEFKALEEQLWKEICLRFGIPAEKPFSIKAADLACLVPEFKQLLPPNRLPTVDRNTKMLEERYPQIIKEAREIKIRVLSQAKAERQFLKAFDKLSERLVGRSRHRTPRQNLWLTQMPNWKLPEMGLSDE
jgi:hypothetical protein